MKTFLIAAVLQRTSIDDMSLTVRASSPEHAYEISRRFLDDYPDNTKADGQTVKFCLCENRQVVDSHVIDIAVEEEVA